MKAPFRITSSLALFLLIITGLEARSQQKQSSDSLMLTIFMKHQQDKNLDSIQAIQQRNGFWKQFPPKTARVMSWHVLMGIGQVITLKFPAGELRTVNRAIEKGAWGAFDTEIYATYDFLPVWEKEFSKQRDQ